MICGFKTFTSIKMMLDELLEDGVIAGDSFFPSKRKSITAKGSWVSLTLVVLIQKS